MIDFYVFWLILYAFNSFHILALLGWQIWAAMWCFSHSFHIVRIQQEGNGPICSYLLIFVHSCCLDICCIFVDICWYLFIFVDRFLYLLIFIHICSYLFIFIDIWLKVLMFVHICWYLLIFVYICWYLFILLRFVHICW